MKGWTDGSRLPQKAGPERRDAPRFPLSLAVRYTASAHRMPEEMGTGRTIDMSSSGLRFSSDRPVLIRQWGRVYIDWPVLLGGNIKLQLVLSGVFIRTNGPEVVLQIHKHDFRTRSVGPRLPGCRSYSAF